MRLAALVVLLAVPQSGKEAPKLAARVVPAGIAVGRVGRSEALLVHNIGPKARPFLHPLVAPDGKGVLTEDRPAHHPWQRGLYVGMHHVNGANFWEREEGFRCKPAMPPSARGNTASWTAEADWLDDDGSVILTETQSWTLTDFGDHYVLDLAHRLTAAVDVVFGRHDYGGLFLRMPWREGIGAVARNSEGLENGRAEGQRARWVAVGMPIEGRADGAYIAVLDHPGNAAHPVPWRVDGQLGIAPSRCILGEWRIPRGKSADAKYRLFVATGRIDPARIQKSWEEFGAKR